MKTTIPQSNDGIWGWLRNSSTRPAARPVNVLPTIRIEPFGREHCGKTALLSCLFRGPLTGAQTSGLELTAADPRVYNLWFRQAIDRYSDMQVRGLVSTPLPSVTEYVLCEADENRALMHWGDNVGQLLSHTTPESDEQQQASWDKAMKLVADADVVLAIVSCPPTSSAADLGRVGADLQAQALNLREALSRRPDDRPVALAAVVNKLDPAFASAGEAREALSDDRLRTILSPLVRLAEGSKKVGLAAIVPVSAFGFGTAVPAPTPPEATAVSGFSPYSEGETEWLLKPNTAPAPYNLTGLVWWSLMAGLLLHPADERGEAMARVARLLADDLRAMDAWAVPLDCRGARAKR